MSPDVAATCTRVVRSTVLDAPADWVLAQLQGTALFRHVTAPLLRFAPVAGPWPAHWTPGVPVVLSMALFGVLPLGRQTVCVSAAPPTHPGAPPRLVDEGGGTWIRCWRHQLHVEALPDGRTRYTDEVHLAGRHLPAVATPVARAFVALLFAHRHRRWRALVRQVGGSAGLLPWERHHAFDTLLAGFRARAQAAPTEAGTWLEAAHVLGQPAIGLHTRSHAHMLRYALARGDLREAAGQCLRLALVPAGHLLRRLPRGNTGRARIDPFAAMEPPAAVQALVDAAVAGAAARARPVSPA